MGMFLSKYSMLSSLGYGGDSYILPETKKILSRFKLFGLIIHDPEIHQDFHLELAKLFERLDYITGHDFLFFCLTDPPSKWIERNNRDYFGIWEPDKLLSPQNAYLSNDKSISAFTLTNGLGLSFDDLPGIVLTTNFQFNQFLYLKTNVKYLEKQLQEIGFFCTKLEAKPNLFTDPEINELIKAIDFCQISSIIKTEDSLAQRLSDFLAFLVLDSNTLDRKRAEEQVTNFINRFIYEKRILEDPILFERFNLFLMGCLSNINKGNSIQNIFDIETEFLEDESKIILRTFNKVYPEFLNIHHTSDYFKSNYLSFQATNDSDKHLPLDFTPLTISLCKIFELEVNLSIIQWIRHGLNIEMPEFYNKKKNSEEAYIITPSLDIMNYPKPIDFNKGYKDKWLAPGLGESEFVCRFLYANNKYPSDSISDFEKYLNLWSRLRQFRNKAAHTEIIDQMKFNGVLETFKTLLIQNYFNQMINLKIKMRTIANPDDNDN